MNYQHDLRLVRMNRDDQSLHCDVHGLLPDDEAREVMERSGLTTSGALVADDHGSSWLKGFWEFVARLSRPKCEPVQ